MPDVSGTVLRGGEPVAGANVVLIPSLDETNCSVSSKYVAISDEKGHFAISGEKELELFVVIGDRFDRWAICVNGSGNVIEALHAGYSHSFEVICELTRQQNVCQGHNYSLKRTAADRLR